jgi:hypothetical protein
MRPYLAIIADSFREALASRVLWILLVLITLILAAILPLGFRAERTTAILARDLTDGRGLVRALQRDAERPADRSPGQRIWSALDEKTRAALGDWERVAESDRDAMRARTTQLAEALNGLLERRDLYDAPAWSQVLLGSEARELLDQRVDTLSTDDLARLNRLLIETPYLEYFRPQPPRQILITYFGAKISPPIRATEKRVRRVIELLVLPAVIGVLVGFVGVLAAILVTAPIIPQMFDPGSLSLLLSKPVSRSWMFLAKFAGGCTFILINVIYLVVGLWVIVGLRLGIWNARLLLCIPIFLFLFAVYYSVSALAGVIWRNAVVCVVMTVVFWLACTVVGATKSLVEQLAVESRRLVRLVEAPDAWIAVDESGATHRWDASTSAWLPAFLEGGDTPASRVLGPVFAPRQDALLAAREAGRRTFGSRKSLLIGRRLDEWSEVDGPALPDGTFELLAGPQGQLLAITARGVEELVGDLAAPAKKLQVFFIEIPQSLGKPFRSAGPSTPLQVRPPAAAAIDRAAGHVAVYSRGELTWLPRTGDQYAVAKSVSVDAEPDQGALLAVAGSTLLLALDDGRVLTYAVPDLALRGNWRPEPGSQPRFACAAPDGASFAIVFHNGRLHLLDAGSEAAGSPQLAPVRGQGDIAGAAFAADNSLLVIDRITRVTRYAAGNWQRLDTFTPALTPLEIAYYYAIVPLYTVFPQPGELDNTIQYVLRGEQTVDLGMGEDTLQARRVRLRPWAPVRSTLVFMLAMLALSCLYVQRQDF